MKIFLSYASQDRGIADSINRALLDQGHDVFFDRDDLPPGEEFHIRIRRAIESADLFILLISEQTLDHGSYTLNEVDIAEHAYKRASGRFLPVLLQPIAMDQLSPFVKSVTVLQTSGNVVAATAQAVHRLAAARRRSTMYKIGGVAALAGCIGLAVFVARGRDHTSASSAAASSSTPSDTIVSSGTTTSVVTTTDSVAGIRIFRDSAPVVRVPEGAFIMGDDEESPMREVFVDAFDIDRYEVTTGRYAKFLAATSSAHPPEEWETLDLTRGSQLPVVGVDWNDATAYCAWAGRRLPTDAEWEKAARGTDKRRFPWGNSAPTVVLGNFENASPNAYGGGLTNVGSFPSGASPFGVDDMAGNVSEWIADWYSESFRVGDGRNPKGPLSGQGRVVRGGSRFEPGYRMAVTRRMHGEPDLRAADIGFRCAHTPSR